MNVSIETLESPFSFFCIPEDHKLMKESPPPNKLQTLNELDFSDVQHGQYLAVLIDKEWQRGIASLESVFLIWLVDQGYYLRPDEKTIFVNLPTEYKKLPSKVFEASIHGVAPIEKVIQLDKAVLGCFEIANKKTTTWTSGHIKKANELISSASRCIFIPIALLSTKVNDIVLGDLYLVIANKGVVNLIDELEDKPGFVVRDKEFYIKNLSKFYTSRKLHRACQLKPAFPNIPTVSLDLTLADYNAICENVPPFRTVEEEPSSDSESETSKDGSTITYVENNLCYESFKLTPQEIEKYAHEYIIISGIEYNVLNILINKARDLKMCEKYKNRKSVGRANRRGVWNDH